MTIEAAGILFVAPDDRALFLSRASSDPNAPGLWDFPGGKIEDTDKDALAAAIRECKEETGHSVKRDDITYHTRRVREGVDFTTFLCRVAEEFTPKLDSEHDGYAWAPIAKPPAPLHPGCYVALQRLATDELGVARLIMAGELTSPQKYENVWLFDIRITGTGVAYRNSLDEFAHRPPEEYLNADFLARCNGLPVIWKHPDNATLNSEEFANRIVGTVFLPYIGDGVRHPAEDVWAIAKIHDEEAARRMQEEQLSTSPGVVLKKEDVKEKMELSNGSTLLLEGKPHLLDHVAICEVGVWDKGNAPTGVVRDGDIEMVDAVTARVDAEETKEEEKKADAEAVTVDKLLKCVDEISRRRDAYEEEERKADARRKDGETEGGDFEKKDARRKDGEEEGERREDRRKDDDDDDDRRKDTRRKDEEDDERDDRRKDARRKDGDEEMEARRDRRRKDADEEDRKDSRRHDARRHDRRHDDDDRRHDARPDSVEIPRAQWDSMMRDMEALKARMPKPLSDQDWHEMHAIQSRADAVYGAFGANSRAPRPMDGETPPNYRRRLLEGLKKHSPLWKDIDLYVAINDSALPNVELAIYNDAMAVARNPAELGEGELRMHERTLPSGHKSVEFYGKPSAWMGNFAGNRRMVGGIRTKSVN